MRKLGRIRKSLKRIIPELRSIWKNSDGIGLIEVMISGVLIAGLAIFAADLARNSMVNQRQIDLRTTRNQLLNEYDPILRNNIARAKTEDFNDSPSSYQDLKDHINGNWNNAGPGSFAPAGVFSEPEASPPIVGNERPLALVDAVDRTVLPAGGLFLAADGSGNCPGGCSATNATWRVAVEWIPLAAGNYDARLVIEHLAANKRESDIRLKPVRSLSSDVAGLWRIGSGDNIYRDIGNVGVGTNAPTSRFHVVGNSFLNGATRTSSLRNDGASDLRGNTSVTGTISSTGAATFGGNTSITGNVSSTGNISASGNSSAQNLIASANISAGGDLTASGQVSANTIVSASTVRVGNSTATCSSAIAGSIRFEPTSRELQYCDGATTSWQNVQQAAATLTTSPEYVLTANRNVGVLNPYGLGGSNETIAGKRSHSADILYANLAIPGTHLLCVLTAYRSTADDSNMYDACYIDRTGPGTWQIEALHHRENAIECRARCISQP